MSKYAAVAVELPHLVPGVWLPPELAKTLVLIRDAGATGIFCVRLGDAGIADPEITVAQLQKEGAVIFIERRPYTDDWGNILYTEDPHYTYKGWIQYTAPQQGLNYEIKEYIDQQLADLEIEI